MTDNFVIELATEDQFASMRNEWTRLLALHDNATLFNTWEWHYTWWITWGKELDGELHLLLAKNKSGELVGIAPLYKHKCTIIRGLISHNSLQFIGSSINLMATVRSEYLDFIFASQYQSVVQALLIHILNNTHWSKAFFSDIRTSSNLFANLTNQYITGKRYYVRATLKDVGITIDTSKSFDDYKESLGKNTRLACYNRRKRLKSQGDIVIEKNIDLKSSRLESLSILNIFHGERWGKHCFDEKALQFHIKLTSYDSIYSGVIFSEILLDGKPTAIIYNIDYNGIRYNIQLGFTMLDDKKISMGNLQLGYAIEDAFKSDNINYFDLLAGTGKKSFYKERFKGRSYRLYTLMVIRSPILRLIYRSYDIFRYLLNYHSNRVQKTCVDLNIKP